MAINVSLAIDGLHLTYAVEHQIDGIYIAKRLGYTKDSIYYHVASIFLHKTDGAWQGDAPNKNLIQLLGQGIDDQSY